MTSISQAHLMVNIQAMLNMADPRRSDQCNICRVPDEIRTLNDLAYTPKVVSIGPLHRLDSKLQHMECNKSANFKKLIQRSVVPQQALLDGLVRLVEEIEPEVRLCYSETLELTQTELCKAILVDACFIIEFFLTFYDKDTSPINNEILFTPWLSSRVRIDLLLLENQLPFFAIKRIFDLLFPSATQVPAGEGGNGNIPAPAAPPVGQGRNRVKLFDLAVDYFGEYKRLELGPNDVGMKHFTDLLRTFFLKSNNRLENRPENQTPKHLPSAVELREAGVRFEVNESQCLLDLEISERFCRGMLLKIPPLLVDDSTETLFRNMIALEQCQYPDESYFTDYVALMDFLINTSQDVDLLVRKKIVLNWLGDSSAVADLFNGLWKNVTHGNFNPRYDSHCKKLNDFYGGTLNNWKASLRRDYCRTPWMALASFAAITVLILTIIQTVASVMQVIPATIKKTH